MERIAALILCGLLCAGEAQAESVGDLVDQAKAQAAEHHLWAPPGDNAQETIDKLWERLEEATPSQLKDLTGIVNQLEATQPPQPTVPPQAATAATSAPAATRQADARPAMSDQTLPPATPAPPRQEAPEAPVPATQPAPAAAAVVAAPKLAPPAAPSLRDERLFVRGQQAEGLGDFSAARRFDMIAARDNYAPAALALGRLYDPAYLAGHRVIGGVSPDIAAARYWYVRARDLGQDQATALLTALPPR